MRRDGLANWLAGILDTAESEVFDEVVPDRIMKWPVVFNAYFLNGAYKPVPNLQCIRIYHKGVIRVFEIKTWWRDGSSKYTHHLFYSLIAFLKKWT